MARFEISIRKNGQKVGTLRDKTSTIQSPFSLEKLVNGDLYEMSVQARNKLGLSPPSEFVAVTPLKIPSAPKIVEVVPGSGEATIFWVSSDVAKKTLQGWFEGFRFIFLVFGCPILHYSSQFSRFRPLSR